MEKVLYITANPKAEEQSYSLSVGAAFLEAYRKEKPEDEIVELDLYQMDVPFIDADVFSGWGKLGEGVPFAELTQEEQQKVGRINELADQFVAADKYVFVTPMWNLGMPPKMKAYVDTFFMAGKSFKYTENGSVGLLAGKKTVHIQARGGLYSEGPAAEVEFGDKYLKAVMNFVGVTDYESVIAEGMAYTPEKAEEIKQQAIAYAQETAKRFAGQTVSI
jgi:FMN-dependent NADH-azoreductase